MKTTRYLIFASVTAVQILCFQNCSSNVKFGDISNASTSGNPLPPDPVCETTFTEETGIVKILFVVDASGSNVTGATTDADKHWRTTAMTNFLERYHDKTNFYYSIITFQGSAARSQINDLAALTNVPSQIQAGVNNFINNTDDGGTPYKAGLSFAKRTIASDLEANPGVEINYSVIMLSDGSPSDYEGIGEETGNGDPAVGTAALANDIADVLAASPEHVSLNTIYYYRDGHANSAAQAIMQSMALDGNGAYLMANSSGSVQIDDIIRIPHTVCH